MRFKREFEPEICKHDRFKMNASQFYYIHNVLGVSSFLKPQKIRSTYHLHYGSEKEISFLFFCNTLNTESDCRLIQKIAQALHACGYIIAEILDPQSTHVPFMLNNLLTRFRPKGFVIFGPDLAIHLNPKTFNAMNSEKVPSPKMIKKPQGSSNQVSVNIPIVSKLSGLKSSDIPIRMEKGGLKSGATQGNRQRSYAKITPEGSTQGNKRRSYEKIRPYKYSSIGKVMETISLNKNQDQSISGCVLHTLSDFTESDQRKVQETKKQAWKILKQVFPL